MQTLLYVTYFDFSDFFQVPCSSFTKILLKKSIPKDSHNQQKNSSFCFPRWFLEGGKQLKMLITIFFYPVSQIIYMIFPFKVTLCWVAKLKKRSPLPLNYRMQAKLLVERQQSPRSLTMYAYQGDFESNLTNLSWKNSQVKFRDQPGLAFRVTQRRSECLHFFPELAFWH